MFQYETSMRKPFFNKAICSSTKKEFSLKISENVQKKKKLSEKLLTGLVSMNIFTDTF